MLCKISLTWSLWLIPFTRYVVVSHPNIKFVAFWGNLTIRLVSQQFLSQNSLGRFLIVSKLHCTTKILKTVINLKLTPSIYILMLHGTQIYYLLDQPQIYFVLVN